MGRGSRNDTRAASTPRGQANPYEVLGVRPDADSDEIKRAYRKLMREWHPDRHDGSPEAVAKAAAISSAYDQIVRGQASPPSSAQPFDFSDFAARPPRSATSGATARAQAQARAASAQAESLREQMRQMAADPFADEPRAAEPVSRLADDFIEMDDLLADLYDDGPRSSAPEEDSFSALASDVADNFMAEAARAYGSAQDAAKRARRSWLA